MLKKILIIAKTYPCISKKYGELVCTAGITESGKFIRLYPIAFRELSKKHRYKKYQWIEVNLKKDKSDPRKESYKVVGNIKLLNILDTRNYWHERKYQVLKNVYYSKVKLIENCNLKGKSVSLAYFKPACLVSFHIETVKNLSDNDTYQLPFKFFYKFTDIYGISSRLQIIDWEISELTRKLFRQYKNDILKIKSILRQKYFYDMLNKDIYLFLGTNKQWHIRKSPNPFMIISIFYPPKLEVANAV